MTELSSSAQAVLNAANKAYAQAATVAQGTADAFRALATRGEAVEIRTAPGLAEIDEVIRVSDIHAIATELEAK